MDNFFENNQHQTDGYNNNSNRNKKKQEELEMEDMDRESQYDEKPGKNNKSQQESQDQSEDEEDEEEEEEEEYAVEKQKRSKASINMRSLSFQGTHLMKLQDALKKQHNLQDEMLRDQYNFKVDGRKILYSKSSLFLFDASSEFRQKVVWLIEQRWFDWFITSIVGINTFLLMFTDFSYRLNGKQMKDPMSLTLKYTAYFFTVVFFSEYFLKIIAMGFVLGQNSYLRVGWNMIDFVVVVSRFFVVVIISVFQLAGGVNLSVLRTIRLLRPLRQFNFLRGLKILISSLLDSLPALGNVVVFLIYLIILFGILGMQLFIGQTESRCRTTDQPNLNSWPALTNSTSLCFGNDDSTCPIGSYCRNPIDFGIIKQVGEDFIPALNYGYTSFDNILASIFTIFQALTTEGWSQFVYIYQNSSPPAIVYIFFILVILMCYFFSLNLVLAVINESFLKNQEEGMIEMAELQSRTKEDKKDKKQRLAKQSTKIHPDIEMIDLDNQSANQDDEKYNEKDYNEKQKTTPNNKNMLSLVPMDDDSDSEDDDSAKRREKELFQIALRPVYYTGRAQLLKKLEDQRNRHAKEKTNFFDPTLTTLNQKVEVHTEESQNNDAHEQIQKVRKYVAEQIIEGQIFIFIVTLFIIANTIVLSLDRYPQSASELAALNTANLVFTLFFMIEMFIKLFGILRDLTFRDSLNMFDCFIVVISLTEQIMDQFDKNISGGTFTAIAAFRALRLFRIFKLARQWTSFRQLLIAIINTLEQISHYMILLVLFMIISAMLGMEFFAYYVRFDSTGSVASNRNNATSSLLNFDTLYNALIFVFVLITGENWNLQTYQYMNGMQSWSPVVFFGLVVIIGNFIMLKLFLVILLYNFGQTTVEAKKKIEEQQQRTGFAQILDGLKTSIKKKGSEDQEEDDKKDEKKKKKTKKPIEEFQGDAQNSDAACFFQGKYDEDRFDQRKTRKQNKLVVRFFDSAQVQDPDDLSDDSVDSDEQRKKNTEWLALEQLRLKQRLLDDNGMKRSIFSLDLRQTFVQAANIAEKEGSDLFGSSLYMFGAKTKFRKVITKLINHKYFEYFIILMIIISSLILALDDPLTQNTDSTLILFDILITSIFMLEALLKIISQGFIINGENSYLRQFGNMLDFIVIIFSALSFSQSSSTDFGKVKIIRVLRVLRPLRLISRNEGLRVSINALILSIPQIINLVLVCVIFFLLFGIFGVNVFKGQFFFCDTRFIPTSMIASISSNRDCFDLGGDWVNQDFNFDNIFNAMVSLFVISTTEGWIDLMFMGVNARGINLQPMVNYHIYWQLFYVGFILVGAFFIQNLFVGVVVDAFNTEQNKLRGYFYLTLEQQEWIDIKTRLLKTKPEIKLQIPKTSAIRKYMFNVTQNPKFEKFILILILMNTVLFMIQFVRQPHLMTVAIYCLNIVFLVLFAIEALMKIIAQGKMYFQESFNVFDLFIITLSLLGFILEVSNVMQGLGTATSILRTFRIVRVLRLLRTAGRLKTMFQTFIITLPALANVGGLLSIILFIYAVLGMNLYPFVRRDIAGGISNNSNFSSFLNSFFTLFKNSTGEQWEYILASCTRGVQPNYICNYEPSFNDYINDGLNACGDSTGYLFHISFQILFATIMLNLFVAVIIEGFQSTVKEERSIVKIQDIEQFQEIWKEFDRNATGFISVGDFTMFMLLLPKPLGWFKTFIDPSDQRKTTQEYLIPAYLFKGKKEAKYYYYDVLKALSYKHMKKTYGDLLPFEPEEPVQAHLDLIQNRQTKLNTIKGAYFAKFNSEDVVACFVIKKHLWHKIQKKYDDEIKVLRVQADEEDALSQQYEKNHHEGSPPQMNNEIDMLIGGSKQMPSRSGRQLTAKQIKSQNDSESVSEDDSPQHRGERI